MRKKINTWWKKARNPLNRLWTWASNGGKKRWKALVEWTREKARLNKRRAKRHLKAARQHRRIIKSRRREIKKIQATMAELDKEIKQERKAEHPDRERIADLRQEKKLERLSMDAAEDAIRKEKKRRRRELARRRHFRKRTGFWLKKHTIYRKQYKKAKADKKAGKQPKFESWMVNGRCTNMTTATKQGIARAVASGQTITSTCDGWPGDGRHSFTSLHYPRDGNPGRAFDCAAAYERMVDFQRDESKRGDGRYQELFGPDSFYVKNGTRYSGAFPAHQDHVHEGPY